MQKIIERRYMDYKIFNVDRSSAYTVSLLLVILSCPVVSASSPFSPVNISHHFHKETTKGKSGVRCTRINRQCLTSAKCVNRKCVCPAGTKGNGEIECVGQGDMLCVVSADPHITTFNNSHVDINLPCRYRLTRFVTGHRSAETPHAYCSVEVYATNELNLGQYYVRSVHISLGITDSGQQVHDQFEVRKYGVSDDQIYNFLANLTRTRTLWGFSRHETLHGVHVYPTFDEENNFAILSVPECGTRVKYRAFDRSTHRQALLPGITINAPFDSKFVKNYGFYPHSLCGSNKDDSRMYKNRAEALGLIHRNLAVIHDILTEEPPQHANPLQAECETAIAAYKSSKDKIPDMNFCGRILIHTKTRKCVVAAQLQPIKVFNTCLNFRKYGGAEDCRVLKDLRLSCKSRWKGPVVQC